MMNDARRSFLSRLGFGAVAFGAAMSSTPTQASTDWQPARHPEDDWYDQPSAKHRLFIDTTEPDAFGQAIAWSRNFLEASNGGYGLKDADAALIICARHNATPFAYTDAMWAKYSAVFIERTPNFVDPKTKQPPVINVYLASGYGDVLRNYGTTLDMMIKRGLRLAVCGMATHRLAAGIATKHNVSHEQAYNELAANLVPSAHIVAAGIVAVNRAQERGYTAASVA